MDDAALHGLTPGAAGSLLESNLKANSADSHRGLLLHGAADVIGGTRSSAADVLLLGAVWIEDLQEQGS